MAVRKLQTIFICFIVFVSAIVRAGNEYDYPKNIVDMGVGVGPNYGMIGVKTVIGHKGTGFLLGLGYAFGDEPGFEVGIQGSIKAFYANLGYGVYHVASYSMGYTNSPPKVYYSTGVIVCVGLKINLVKQKWMFLDLGVGACSGGEYRNPITGGLEGGSMATFNAGLGFRFGQLKKNKAE